MKILITTDCYMPTVNGVVTSIINLETELRRLGHEVKILCPSQNFRCSDDGDVYRIGSVNAGKIYNGARAALKIQRRHLQKIIDWKPDIIHSQTEFTAFIMAKKIAGEVGCPIVHTYHTVYENYTHYFSPVIAIGRKAVMQFTRRILRNVQTVIAPSGKIEDLLKGYGIDNEIKVVPTGLRLEKFTQKTSEEDISQLKAELNIPVGSRVLVTVGRAAKEKNIGELITYFKQQNAENTVLLIVGGGPFLDELKQLAQRLEVSDRVFFTGMVSPEKIAEYYKTGDIFVSASQSETQGLTYIEAMASGLPLVCRKDDCLNGVIADGENGYQYTGFETFSQAVTRILDSGTLRKTMSQMSAELSMSYTSEAFALKAEQIYKDAIAKFNEDKEKQYEITNTLSDCRDCG